VSGKVTPIGVARFDNGQRVFVRQDYAGLPVNQWGKVVRLRRGDHGAWVALDKWHERCPFPITDARGTHILTYPECCSSFEPPAPAARGCRRCGECEGQPHHWLTSMPECPEGGEAFIPCKHCDARARVCDECCEGPVWPADANNRRCELCNAPGGV
jgi:hypothetical protein